ncbi:hypothetical protein [Paraburkholderia guartelaensis]|uniref:hypothetical protein n=1 Tax=Paraburkholderia guartelaensis TaxID=2546446 RepID=UPI002AB7B7CC|nr:hypothetical protein [Paraburkholderia guartelaensis]
MANRLPKGLRRRSGRDGKVNYYLKLADGVRELRLYGDLDCVLAQWRTHQIAGTLQGADVVHISDLLEMFEKCEIPVRRIVEGEQCSYLIGQVRALIAFFKEHGNPGLFSRVPPAGDYLLWRGASHVYRANGEVRLLNHVFRWARLHTSIPIGESPWEGASPDEKLREETLKEVGTAMAFYRLELRADVNLVALREHSIKQLKLDGRPDLAEALRKLTVNDVQCALALAAKAMAEGSAPKMILGTRRSARLHALRHTTRSRSTHPNHDRSGWIKDKPDDQPPGAARFPSIPGSDT